MWATYWKRFPITQIFILAICAVLHYHFNRSWSQVLPLLLAMEVGGVMGAWWGHRLAQRLARENERLPLDKR